MNKSVQAVLGIAAVVGGVYVATLVTSKPKHVHKFDPAIDQVVGDENGVVCHDLYLVAADGKRTQMSTHKLWKYDFRHLTPQEKRDVLTADIDHDMDDAGLACFGPDGTQFFRPAQSDEDGKRHNPGGGGCSSHSCAAHVREGGGCELGGVSCVITLVCCPGECPAACQ